MPNNIRNVSFGGNPTDYTLEAQNIERKRRLADALVARGMAPDGGTQMVGGWAIPKSPMENFGKLAQTLSGRYQNQQLDDRQKTLADSLRTQNNTDAQSFTQALTGTPEQPAIDSPPDEFGAGPGRPVMPAVAADPNKAIAIALQTQNPLIQGAGKTMFENMVKKTDSPFAKIDASKFTPESIKAFITSGANNPALLVAREKIVADKLGDKLQYRGEYSKEPTGSAPINVSPDTVARIGQQERQFNNLSAYQQAELPIQRGNLSVAQGNLGVNRTNSYYNTGMGAAGGGVNIGNPPPPTTAMPPYAGPGNARTQSPPAAPAASGGLSTPTAPLPGMTPKQVSENQAERYKSIDGARQILNAIGYDPATGNDTVSEDIKKSTSGMTQNMIAQGVGAVTGSATSGREAIGRLTVASNKLIMDLMGGKLGSGISNADRDFIAAQLGDVGNANIPANERLAAWHKAVSRLSQIVSQANGGADRRQAPRTNSGRVVVDY